MLSKGVNNAALSPESGPAGAGGPFSLKSAIKHWPSVTEARQEEEKPKRQAQWLIEFAIFITASRQTGLDTRSMTRSSIIEEIRGGQVRTRASAQALLGFAGHRPTYWI